MGALLRTFLKPIMKPLVRLVVGMLAIPLFRLVMRRVARVNHLDEELEKDLEEWFRGAVLLLFATKNVELWLFQEFEGFEESQWPWLTLGLRLLLVVGVIEAMPDQQLFGVIHPPPKPPKPRWREPWWGLPQQLPGFGKGLVCQHLNRSSPVFAIMAAVFGGAMFTPIVLDADTGKTVAKVKVVGKAADAVEAKREAAERVTGERRPEGTPPPRTVVEYRWNEDFVVGWVCYGLAITQYLIIGLVTSKEKAVEALAEFDRRIAERRAELVEEFDVEEAAASREKAARKAERPAVGAVDGGDRGPADE